MGGRGAGARAGGTAYLWSGPGRGLLGEVRLLSGDPFGPLPPDTPNTAGPGAVVLRRVDGFLGFRHSPDALSNGAALMAAWTGSFTATSRPGHTSSR